MDWLLGITSGIGVCGSIVFGFIIYKQGKQARQDLREIVSLTKTSGELQRDNDGYKRVVETRDEAIEEKENELSRAKKALEAATDALVVAHQKLAERGDADAVANDINDILGRIRNWN